MGQLIIIMGVSGSGKTTVGQLLAAELGLPFYDADDFHPENNVSKMKAGNPLNDEDRDPWLRTLASNIDKWTTSTGAVLACSALKESYRKKLVNDHKGIIWIILRGSYELILSRIMARKDHFFSGELLQSQFDTVEWPEYGCHLQIEESPSSLVEHAISTLNLQRSGRIGLIGLGVMGSNLSRNLLRNGFRLSVYNRDTGNDSGIVGNFVDKYSDGDLLNGYTDYRSFVNSLSTPRIIIIMVKAGEAVDFVIEGLIPYLQAGDVLIDAGNSFYKDTERRTVYLREYAIDLIGMGVSGGASGALNGPSLMPGGKAEIINQVLPMLNMIAARDKNGKPCVTPIGPGGAGHFVKMVHNGIEYAEMQLLAEIYAYLKMSMKNKEIAGIFSEWSRGETGSYLLEITHRILLKRLSENEYWIDQISDKAGSKGTGNWTLESASELGVPATAIQAAVSFRMISNLLEERKRYSNQTKRKKDSFELMDLKKLQNVYQAARILNHHQGFELLKTASKEYGWDLNLSEIARVWTNGCIIRSRFMDELSTVLREGAIVDYSKLFNFLNDSEEVLAEFIKSAADHRVAVPAHSSTFNYWIALTTKSLPTNLIQAQRDFFGGHGINSSDDPNGPLLRLNWNE